MPLIVVKGKKDCNFVSSIEKRVFYQPLTYLAVSHISVEIMEQASLVLIPEEFTEVVVKQHDVKVAYVASKRAL